MPLHSQSFSECTEHTYPCGGCSLPPLEGSRVGLPGWQSVSCAGNWWWGGWWRPCPAGWWWRRGAEASLPARRTQSFPSPGASERRHVTSLSLEPATWQKRKNVSNINICCFSKPDRLCFLACDWQNFNPLYIKYLGLWERKLKNFSTPQNCFFIWRPQSFLYFSPFTPKNQTHRNHFSQPKHLPNILLF